MDKQKLKAAFSQIEKQHGAGTVFRLGSSRRLAVKVISTGILPIDIASGVGGVPKGRVVEIFGPESGGKTTLALHIIAQAQKAGGLAAFLDAEHGLDPVYAKALGVDVDNLVVSQPDNGEQALEVTETLIKSEQFAVIVIDSVAALVPKAELAGEMGDPQMGLQARLMSQALRKLVAVTAKTDTCLIFINQVRDKIGVFYGNPETTTGGRALKFYASMRITVRASTRIKEGDKEVGYTAKVKFVKNKVATPHREAEVEAIYGKGFPFIPNLVDGALTLGVLAKSGAWFTFNGDSVGQGRNGLITILNDDAVLLDQLQQAVTAKMAVVPDATKEIVDDE